MIFSRFAFAYIVFLLYLCTRFLTETIMKRILRYFGALLFAGMPFSVIHGENITHNFQSMNTEPRTIEFQSANTYARSTKDAITYTCGGTSASKFGLDHVYKSVMSINLLNYGDSVIISPAIDNLRGFDIFYEPANEKRNTIQVYLSTDGISWGEPLTGENIAYAKGVINVTPPSGSYQIKIVDTNGSYDASITEIDYMIENCNCFRYVP